MSRYVQNGTLDAGLTGKDWIAENSSDVHVVADLVYSKVSSRSARWVVAVPYDSPVKRLEDLAGKKIATELTEFTKRYFAERNIEVIVEFSWGATEAKVVSGLVDAIVEVTETESTIRALKGALLGQKMVGLKMNVPGELMEKIIKMLPSLNAPTVASLYQSNWFSVEIVVASDTVRELIPKLLEHGAEGIIEYPLNKVV
jgi:ATP phosphoribosyltransferase